MPGAAGLTQPATPPPAPEHSVASASNPVPVRAPQPSYPRAAYRSDSHSTWLLPASSGGAPALRVWMTSSGIAVVLFAAGGQVHAHTLAQVAVAAVALVTGYTAGAAVYSRLTSAHFRGIVLGVLVASALLSLATAVG